MSWWTYWSIPARELGPAQGPVPGLEAETTPARPVFWIGPVPWRTPAAAAPTSPDVDIPAAPAPVVVDGAAPRERDLFPEPAPIAADDGDLPAPPLPGQAPGAGFNIFDVRRTVQTVGTGAAVTGNPALAGAARLLDLVLSLFTPRPQPAQAPAAPTAPAPTGAAIGAAPAPVLDTLVQTPEVLPAPQAPAIEREFTPTRERAGYDTRELTGTIEGGSFRGTVETVRGTRSVEVELPFPEVGF